jgi:hypothetical protein
VSLFFCTNILSLTFFLAVILNCWYIDNCDQLLEEVKKKCPSLRYLSLLGNTACPNPLLGYGHDEDDYRRYRLYVLYRLPNLKFLDSSIVSEDERKEAKRVGQFMKVVKPSENQVRTYVYKGCVCGGGQCAFDQAFC